MKEEKGLVSPQRLPSWGQKRVAQSLLPSPTTARGLGEQDWGRGRGRQRELAWRSDEGFASWCPILS